MPLRINTVRPYDSASGVTTNNQDKTKDRLVDRVFTFLLLSELGEFQHADTPDSQSR